LSPPDGISITNNIDKPLVLDRSTLYKHKLVIYLLIFPDEFLFRFGSNISFRYSE